MEITNSGNSFFRESVSRELITNMRKKFGDTKTNGRDKLTSGQKEILSKIICLVEDESLSIDYLRGFLANFSYINADKEKIETIFELRDKGKLATKGLGLYQQFNIHVYTEKYKNKKDLKVIAYKNITNIQEELCRIYNYVFKPVTPVVDIDPYKYLNINNRLPDILTGKEVLFYSFILNYDSSVINQNEIMKMVFDLSGLTANAASMGFNFNENTTEDTITANRARWDELGSLYYRFFRYLEENTLSYH